MNSRNIHNIPGMTFVKDVHDLLTGCGELTVAPQVAMLDLPLLSLVCKCGCILSDVVEISWYFAFVARCKRTECHFTETPGISSKRLHSKASSQA